MSKLFSTRTKTPEYGMVADPYKEIREPTIDWLKGQLGKPAEQYTGEFVAPTTPQEKESLDYLKKYTEAAPAEGITLAGKEYQKTLSGQYDPTTSGYYQAVKAESARNLAETQKQIADVAAGGGRYWGGARLTEQREASTDAAIAMNKLLYGMQETERGRRLQAAPLAAQLGEYEEKRPLGKAAVLQELGGMERTLEQARMDAVYNEWLRATQEYPLQIATLASGVQREPYYTQKQPDPVWWKKLLGAMAPSATSMLSGMIK